MNRPPGSSGSSPRIAGLLVTAAVVIAAVGAGVAALAAGGGADTRPLPGLASAGPVAVWGLPIARTAAHLFAAGTIGLLLAAAALTPSQPDERRRRLGPFGWRAVRVAAVFALGWLVASVAVAVLTVSQLLAIPVRAVNPTMVAGFAVDVVAGRALLLAVIAAIIVAAGAARTLTVRGAALLVVVAAGGLLPAAFAGHASGSGNHQLAVSSLLIHTGAAAVWAGGLIALLVVRRLPTPALARAAGRYATLAAWCLAAVTGAGLLNAATRLPDVSALWDSGYGRLVAVKAAAVLVIAALGWIHRRVSLPALAAGRRGAFSRLATVETVALAAVFGVAAALGRTPPPDAGQEESIVRTLLGFDLPPSMSAARLAGDWLPEPIFLTAAALAVGFYLAGWWRLRRRGDAWPLRRLAGWIAGWAVVAVATSSGLARYAPVLFSVHVAQHLALAMLAPILLVLAAPLTLASRALRPAPDPDWPGPREWITALLSARPVRLAVRPPVAFTLYAGSLYALYLTGLYEASLRSHAVHLAMYAAVLAVGYLFFGLLVGADPRLRPVSYPARLALLVAAMAAQTILGLVIGRSTAVIAAGWHTALARPWGPDPLADQHAGGAIAWASGALTALVVAILLITAWMRTHDRNDRAVDPAGERAATDDHGSAGAEPAAPATPGAPVATRSPVGVGDLAEAGDGTP